MIRFYNGRVLTLAGDGELSRHEVWVEDGVISYVGPAKTETPAFEREIDLRGDLLLPGFKNAHAHSAMCFARSFADDVPLQEWLFDKIFPMEARLQPEDVYALTRLAILEYLSGGITAAFDMYFHRSAIARAAIDSGFRMVLCGALSAGDDIAVGMDDCARFNALHPLISYFPGIHAEYTSDTKILGEMSELTHAFQKPFFAHNAETAREVAECRERHGCTPTVLFERYGLFDYGGGGFHCVHFTPEDMEIFARRQLWAVTCPASNAKLASGIAPLGEFRRRGIPMAIGTDGASSNNALNMFREMYLAAVLSKLREGDAAEGDAAQILTMACQGSARAMGLADADSIAPGKRADLVVLDLSAPNMQPEHNIVKNLVYAGSNQNVRLTMVNGRILYEDVEFFVGESAAEIRRRAAEATKRLTQT